MEVTSQAVIVGVASILGTAVTTIVMAMIAGRQKRKDKQQDWDRQDVVAAKVAIAADQAARAAALLVESNSKVDSNAKILNDKVDIIHVLVNSNMTAAMQDQLDARISSLASLKEILALKEASDQKPSPDSLATIKSMEAKVNELKANLADRLTQSKAVDVIKRAQA